MSVFDDIFEQLAAFRNEHEKKHNNIPEHEIVMRPDKWRDLMQDPRSIVHINHLWSQRNFAGCRVLVDHTRIEPHIEVRERTRKKHD